MTKVAEFYILKTFHRPMKWVRELNRGKVLEFCPQTKKPAYLAFGDHHDFD